MTAEVVFREAAQTDLFEFYRYIADQAGRIRAGAYIDRIEAACLQLAEFPERGTRRDDLGPGLRTIGVERLATIIFRIDEGTVVIGRILYGGRDLQALLDESR
ncbi:MAG: type II toxin-antitoxin system RelE/ParE family toxin [Methylobacterium sp.]|uniref:type II toxin-antitoxin system RelE/ParE family toxin n=1 Tax=Methylobacterium sp. TaxID=409 RepID=UPI0025E86F51|nr:type II toxin-antitoxin system RelE/ParE family toxin [Methylobacterium sp.]MBX9931207.1 type II toxin-antitoxin system RelE/ParE family toxin [Methylobacterium sp.]